MVDITQLKMYIRVSNRIGFESEKHWKKGYIFMGYQESVLGSKNVERNDQIVVETDLLGKWVRTHLAESVTLKSLEVNKDYA